jgi:hypothetical protein
VILRDRDERGEAVGVGLGGEPAVIMLHKSLAVGEAQQGGAVVDFGRELVVGECGFLLGDSDEPGAEGGTVFGGVEVEGVGKAVVMGVGGVGEVLDVEGVAVVAPGVVPREVELGGTGNDGGSGDGGEGVVDLWCEVEFGIGGLDGGGIEVAMAAASDFGDEVGAAVGADGDGGAGDDELVAGAATENKDSDGEKEGRSSGLRTCAGRGRFHALGIIGKLGDC